MNNLHIPIRNNKWSWAMDTIFIYLSLFILYYTITITFFSKSESIK